MADREAEMRLMLRALRLPAIAAQYQDLAIKAAKANMTHESYLYELVRAECLQRVERQEFCPTTSIRVAASAPVVGDKQP